jgi:hypothetical protein
MVSICLVSVVSDMVLRRTCDSVWEIEVAFGKAAHGWRVIRDGNFF